MEALAYAETYAAVQAAGDNAQMRPKGDLADLVDEIDILIAEEDRARG